MHQNQSWFAGVDWASQKHDIWLADGSGKRLGKRTVEHTGEGLAQMCDWLAATSGGKPEDIHVAIEVPHGPVVETLLDRGFKVYAINPRQLDRFRDRFSPAGATVPARIIVPAFPQRSPLWLFDHSSSRWLGISSLVAEPEGPPFISYIVTIVTPPDGRESGPPDRAPRSRGSVRSHGKPQALLPLWRIFG